jgi:moderate conductance mechanosensitive channel
MIETIKSTAEWLTTSGIKIIGILISLVVLYQMSRWIVKWMEKFVPKRDPLFALEARKRAHTLGNILRHTFLIIISYVALLMILGELGIQVAPLLATAGIGALAIGFGAQNLVKDVISGFFIILENQYRIGDAIEVSGVSGVVESVGLRTTVLRDLEGKVHTVLNGEIKVVSNLSKEWSRSVVDVPISYREDIDRVTGVLQEMAREIETEEPYKSNVLEPLDVLGVNRFGDTHLVIRVIVKTLPMKQWEVSRALRQKIKKRFDEAGIRIAPSFRILPGEEDNR